MKRKAKGDSYEIVSESQSETEKAVVLPDTDAELNNKRKTPTKIPSQTSILA